MVPNDTNWSGLGLKGNPFENVLPGERLDWVDVARPIREALEARPFRVELVGDKGAGKTTTLRWYAATHADVLYQYVEGAHVEVEWDGARVLCLDEANKASPSSLRRLLSGAEARGVSLLFSSHQSLSDAVPGVKSFELARHHALSWVNRRVAAAALLGHAHFDFDAVARALFPRVSHVNYALLRVLYELAENLARGVEAHAALEDALRRAREDATVGHLLHH
ncbi:MAG: hypothetical protein IT380_10585 [Myxococcales bacterium]|nr:hypothetical protein [Myxococcales bacterium]